MSEANEIRRNEIEALSAIYGKDFTLHDDETFDLRICCDKEKWWAVTISVLLPTTYPNKDPPIFEIHTECLSGEELQSIYSQLDLLWKENMGESILHIWTEKIRDMLFEKYETAKLFIESSAEEKERERSLTDLMRGESSEDMFHQQQMEEETPRSTKKLSDSEVPKIISGETITLKKSTFQGHVAIVHTLEEVKYVLRKLKENRKVAQASHNILAYRLSGTKENSYIQDYADDGEVNAGGRLLHLLQIMNVENIVVVVSRWYGGILLGPDRFRLISNCAREVVVASGCYTPKQEKSKHKQRKH
ncbi:protein IMPACT-B-like [Hydractinia symbiolongicarpus]|uniref:protein IMPACT-B-like n=1 Tax=Hydractinia symbiolongicarpus TaxID=13093 RepID=UPI00254D6E0E|nr:protein IMPACT-B-like [Hydractinia symbiolongicarpus]